jgi:hypothetical protein
MTQKELDVLFSLTISIHEHEWFNKRNRDQVQEWVAKQLAESLGIFTIPIGMSWGSTVSKEHFDEYWNKHGKIKTL